MFSVMSVRQPVILSMGRGSCVTITRDALHLSIQYLSHLAP